MDIYRELILDHYKHPRNFGQLERPDVIAEEHNATCGDTIKIEAQFSSEDSIRVTIADIRFSGEGCAISQASASMLTEKVLGLPVKEALTMRTSDVITMLGIELTPARVKCATLALEVLQKAIRNKYT